MNDHFSPDALSEIYEIDVETFEEIIDCYISDTPPTFRELTAAINANDAQTLRERAHKIKGSSSTIGVLHVAALAFELETIGRKGSCDNASDLAESLGDALTAGYDWLTTLKAQPPY